MTQVKQFGPLAKNSKENTIVIWQQVRLQTEMTQ